MAKQTSILRIQGTVNDVTYVSSAAYGDHLRARRGTHKPAPVNARLRKEGKMMVMSNVPAKIFKDAIDPYRRNNLGGTLWARLVSHFQKQFKKDGKFDFTTLKPFEIHEDFPMNKFLVVQSTTTKAEKKSILQIELRYNAHPHFKRQHYVDGYVLTVIGVFPDLKKKKALTTEAASTVMTLIEPVSPLILQLDIPPKATEYVICLKLEGTVNKKRNETRTTTALCVIDAGKI